jgi:hypothetical protein
MIQSPEIMYYWQYGHQHYLAVRTCILSLWLLAFQKWWQYLSYASFWIYCNWKVYQLSYVFGLRAHTTQVILSCSGILCTSIILGLSDNHVEYLHGSLSNISKQWINFATHISTCKTVLSQHSVTPRVFAQL